MSILHFINKNKMEIVYAENTEIWRGCHVLHDFVEMISLEAKKTLVDFSEKYPLEYYNFQREVKTKIRLTSSNSSKLSIQLSPFMLNETRYSENMQESILRKECEDELDIKLDKCVIKSERSKILVSEAGKRIVDYIETELFAVFSDINHIILVGEFAQSPMLQEILKASFSTKNIVIPGDANMAAVRGAVFFGQRDVSVKTNVSLFYLNKTMSLLLKELFFSLFFCYYIIIDITYSKLLFSIDSTLRGYYSFIWGLCFILRHCNLFLSCLLLFITQIEIE